MTNLSIRAATTGDIQALYTIAAKMKAAHEKDYFERCFSEGRRVLALAETGGEAVGYAIVNYTPTYPPFRRLNIPEIQDLNVVPDARRNGTGEKLVAWCEALLKSEGHGDAAISVGLDASYGAAQRLYVRMGYVPDGAGIAYDDVPVTKGELRPVDGLLTLKLVKSLA